MRLKNYFQSPPAKTHQKCYEADFENSINITHVAFRNTLVLFQQTQVSRNRDSGTGFGKICIISK
jgi:hypothetical protein